MLIPFIQTVHATASTTAGDIGQLAGDFVGEVLDQGTTALGNETLIQGLGTLFVLFAVVFMGVLFLPKLFK